MNLIKRIGIYSLAGLAVLTAGCSSEYKQIVEEQTAKQLVETVEQLDGVKGLSYEDLGRLLTNASIHNKYRNDNWAPTPVFDAEPTNQELETYFRKSYTINKMREIKNNLK